MSDYADEPWFKIQRRVFESSVWEEDLATRIVWLTLLALAQAPEHRKLGHGTVAITPGNLLRVGARWEPRFSCWRVPSSSAPKARRA
jgi:hypothetical protein